MSDSLFPAAPPRPEPKGPFVVDLAAETSVTSSFLVLRKDVRQKQNGEAYLSLTLGDRTGQIEAAMWDHVAEIQSGFERDDFIKVRGYVGVYRDKLQLKIDKLRRLDESAVELADYLPCSRANLDELWSGLQARVAAMRNPHLRALLEALLGDEEIAARYRRAPAAKTLHHAYLGGLLEHVCSLCGLAEMAVRHYPFLDGDLVLSGIVLHDLGKIYELGYERSFTYTTRGQLLGHMVMVLEILHLKIAMLPDFPPRLQTLLEHLIISHHGRYEFGSPKLPMFPEAVLLHQLDDLDSKMNAMQTQLGAEGGEGEWTAYNRSLERPLLRVQDWLNQVERVEAGAAAASGETSIEQQAARLQAAFRGGAK